MVDFFGRVARKTLASAQVSGQKGVTVLCMTIIPNTAEYVTQRGREAI